MPQVEAIKFLPFYGVILRRIAHPISLLRYLICPDGDTLTIQFREGDVLYDVRDPFHAISMIMWYDFSKRIGAYSSEDLVLLNTIGADITCKLKRDELSPGAHFGYQPALLYALVRKFRPKRVIETGVAQGVSSYCILAALHRNGNGGRLVSIDLPNYDATYVGSIKEAGWLVPDKFRGDWDILIGRSSEILPRVAGQIDLFYHDSLHNYETMLFEYEWAYGHLGPGGVIASDDINASKAYRDFKRRHADMKEILKIRKFGNLIRVHSASG